MDKLYIVSLELGKLLKENGFDEWCLFQYVNSYGVKESIIEKHGGLSDDGYLDLLKDYGGEYERDEVYENRIELKQVHTKNSMRIFFDKQICSAPHIFDAKMWFEEKYNVKLKIEYNFNEQKYVCSVIRDDNDEIEQMIDFISESIDKRDKYNNEMEAIEKTMIKFFEKKYNI